MKEFSSGIARYRQVWFPFLHKNRRLSQSTFRGVFVLLPQWVPLAGWRIVAFIFDLPRDPFGVPGRIG